MSAARSSERVQASDFIAILEKAVRLGASVLPLDVTERPTSSRLYLAATQEPPRIVMTNLLVPKGTGFPIEKTILELTGETVVGSHTAWHAQELPALAFLLDVQTPEGLQPTTLPGRAIVHDMAVIGGLVATIYARSSGQE